MFNKYLSNTLADKKNEIFENKEISSEVNTLIDESIKIIANTAFSIIQDMEIKGKKIQLRTSKSFQQETNAIFQSITDTRDKLLNLFKISREIKTPPTFLHDVLVGESSILISLRDIITRARKTLLIFMPIPEIKSLMNLIELSQQYSIKIDVIGDVKKTPTLILEKVKNEGIGINLRQLEVDFWGVLMDEEEFLFAPNPAKEEHGEITGIFTTYIPLIQSYTEQLKKLIMRAQPI